MSVNPPWHTYPWFRKCTYVPNYTAQHTHCTVDKQHSFFTVYGIVMRDIWLSWTTCLPGLPKLKMGNWLSFLWRNFHYQGQWFQTFATIPINKICDWRPTTDSTPSSWNLIHLLHFFLSLVSSSSLRCYRASQQEVAVVDIKKSVLYHYWIGFQPSVVQALKCCCDPPNEV